MVPGEPNAALRVCFFNRSYPPDTGATGQLLAELAGDLASRHGCRVSVVAGPPTFPAEGTFRHAWRGLGVQREVVRGVNLFWAMGTTFRPTRFVARSSNYLTYFLSACLAALRLPKQDVVVALTDPPIIGLAALLATRRSGARFVFLCEDVFPEAAILLEDFRSGAANWLLAGIRRLLVRKADAIVAVGETMRARLISGKGAPPQKVAVIHNWADCNSIRPGPRRNAFSKTHGLHEAFAVMHSGNVGLSQNLDVLLEAAEMLRPYPEIVFLIVGEGVKRPSLETRARDRLLSNVRFLPYQPKENLADSFAAADVFVVSLKKGLSGCIVPSKVYGILAAGRPFIAATEEDCEAAIIARRHDCGLCARVGDPDDLAEKILALYRDRELARRLGENGRKAALQFDRPVAVQMYHELFRKLI